MDLKPLGDRVLVEPAAAEETVAGGIVLPETAQPRSNIGKVKAVGPGATVVAPGDAVLLPEFGGRGAVIKLDGREYLLIREPELLAILAKK